jgi:hypothetical protein
MRKEDDILNEERTSANSERKENHRQDGSPLLQKQAQH